jgi:anhydro-N-acetylmuramic acid kinase
VKKREIFIAGVMTGTSADGVDLSLSSFSGGTRVSWKSLSSAYYPFPRSLFEKIIRFQEREAMDKKEFLKFALTHGSYVGRKSLEFFRNYFGNRMPSNLAVAYHGQTIAHYPDKENVGGGRYSLTLQAGDSSVLSQITGLTVISDFRVADLAAGGTGAPLAPPFHAFLLKKVKGTCAFLNIGGIGNITVVEAGKVVTASDTGPGNMLIDGAVRYFSGGRRRFDRGGKIAGSGSISGDLVRFIVERDEFLARKKPASTGRENYGEGFLQKILSFSKKRSISDNDVIATLTHYTGLCVARFLKESGISHLSKVFVAGGGARNTSMMSVLSNLLPARDVASSHEIGVDPDFVESYAFAYLGYCCLAGIFLDTAPFTGGGRAIPGRITPGDNYRRLMRYLHRA